MVQDKLIVILIICAILISAVSVFVTLSVMNTNLIPDEPKININRVIDNPVDSGKAHVAVTIAEALE
jgi:hypothetical protein